MGGQFPSPRRTDRMDPRWSESKLGSLDCGALMQTCYELQWEMLGVGVGETQEWRALVKTTSNLTIRLGTIRGENRQSPAGSRKGHFVKAVRREIELGFAETKEKVEGLGNYIDGHRKMEEESGEKQ